MRRRRERGAGFTLIELLIVVAIIGVLAAVAIPGLMRARITANESSAIASLRVVNTAEAAYAATAGKTGHAALLATLALSCGGGGSAQGFISPDLRLDPTIKSGYTIALSAESGASPGPVDCNGTATVTGYYASAVPLWPQRTGYRGFATDDRGSIWQDLSGAAPAQPFTPSSDVSTIR